MSTLYTGLAEILILGEWGQGGRVSLEQADPLPLEVVAITREFEVGGR